MNDNYVEAIPVPSKSKLHVSPSKSMLPDVPETPSKKRRKAISAARKKAYDAKVAENEQKKAEQEEKRYQKELAAAEREGRRQGMTTKSKIIDTAKHAKSEIKKLKKTKVEIVDEELEAARKKGYDARMAEKRQRELAKAEQQGRRQAMTTKSKIKEDVTPVAKRVAKNAKGLARELAVTPGQIAQTIGQTAIEMEKVKQHAKRQAAAKPQAKTQKKEKPGPAVRKGGYPAKQNRDGPGRRRETFGVKSKHGPTNNRPNAKLHRSAQPLPQNIPKATAVVNKQRSVNFAMRARRK